MYSPHRLRKVKKDNLHSGLEFTRGQKFTEGLNTRVCLKYFFTPISAPFISHTSFFPFCMFPSTVYVRAGDVFVSSKSWGMWTFLSKHIVNNRKWAQVFHQFLVNKIKWPTHKRRKDDDITSGSKTMVLCGRLFVGLKEPSHLFTSRKV